MHSEDKKSIKSKYDISKKNYISKIFKSIYQLCPLKLEKIT